MNIFIFSGLICGEFGSRMGPRGGPNGGWIEDETHPGRGSELEAIWRPVRGRQGGVCASPLAKDDFGGGALPSPLPPPTPYLGRAIPETPASAKAESQNEIQNESQNDSEGISDWIEIGIV